MNLRAANGLYRKDTSKNKCYENVYIEFTREEFKRWCQLNIETIKLLKKPSIDRKDSKLNYTLDNIQIIELEQNISKKKFGCAYINGPKSSDIRGIRKTGNKWSSRIHINNKGIHLGTFETKEEAMNVFREAYFKHYGRMPY